VEIFIKYSTSEKHVNSFVSHCMLTLHSPLGFFMHLTRLPSVLEHLSIVVGLNFSIADVQIPATYIH